MRGSPARRAKNPLPSAGFGYNVRDAIRRKENKL